MEAAGHYPLDSAPAEEADAQREREQEQELDLVEGAARLVASGAATRVRLCSLAHAGRIAAAGAAAAQRYGVAFRLERHADGVISILVGPPDAG